MIDRRNLLKGAALLAGTWPASSIAKPSDAGDIITLTAKEVDFSLAREDLPASPFWFYNGLTPGPEIRVRRGEKVKVRLLNELAEPTSVHWHGIRLANSMDGVAGLTQPAVQPGESFDYEFVAPDAGTYWYHAHNKSWNQVARGLYGALIVEEPDPAFPPANDITLVIDDWRVDQQGKLDLASFGNLMDWSHAGRLGNLITVNGTFRPELNVAAGKTSRLRLINASNARIFQLALEGTEALVMALDGQPVPEPFQPVKPPLILAPAQRIDLLVRPIAGEKFALATQTARETIRLADFSLTGEGTDRGRVPAILFNSISEPDTTTARHYRLDMTGGAMGNFVETTYQGKILSRDELISTRQVWAFNGVANLADTPMFSVERGETVSIDIVNDTAFAHAMHVHGHHFCVVTPGADEIDLNKPWRDTLLVAPERTARIAFVAENPGKWLLHCHMLEHAAAGMNSWFEVT